MKRKILTHITATSTDKKECRYIFAAQYLGQKAFFISKELDDKASAEALAEEFKLFPKKFGA